MQALGIRTQQANTTTRLRVLLGAKADPARHFRVAHIRERLRIQDDRLANFLSDVDIAKARAVLKPKLRSKRIWLHATALYNHHFLYVIFELVGAHPAITSIVHMLSVFQASGFWYLLWRAIFAYIYGFVVMHVWWYWVQFRS